MSTERSSKGRSFHADGPTIEKALRCIIAKWARGTKNSPLAAERSTRRAARTDTGQQRTNNMTNIFAKNIYLKNNSLIPFFSQFVICLTSIPITVLLRILGGRMHGPSLPQIFGWTGPQPPKSPPMIHYRPTMDVLGFLNPSL